MSENSIYMPLYFFTQVLTTSLAFIFYIRYVGQTPITFVTVVKVIFISTSLPVTLYLKNRLDSYQVRLKTLLHESRLIQDKLKQFSENYNNKFIELISENEADNFRMQVSEIVFVKSANNYVEIAYHDEGAVKKKMIRNTMKNVELQLSEFNNFIRTHRTSIVNIQYVNKLNKNFNTYWLSLDYTKETIPVSRQYLMAVKELL
jgi:DNA-binding LytR/AlgR family response regulator